MNNRYVLDEGYVIYFPDSDEYWTSNVGIFKTKRGAEKRCAIYKKRYHCEVRKVEIVLLKEKESEF